MNNSHKKILGISDFYHDCAATFVIGGKLIAAAQEERFARVKYTPDLPVSAIKYCLEADGSCNIVLKELFFNNRYEV